MTTKRRLVEKRPAVGAFGQKLRSSRLAANFTAEEVGEMLGVSGSLISQWEIGKQRNIKQAYLDKLAELFEWDSTPREGEDLRRSTAPPVAVTSGLRIALSTVEDEFSYSKTKILHSIQYLNENIPRLIERLEKSAREIQHIEQSQGVTQEQLAVLRDKARRYDQMQELMGKKGL